jgi:hypothetical protein
MLIGTAIVVADARRVVALGAKTGEEALTFRNSQLDQSLVASAATKEGGDGLQRIRPDCPVVMAIMHGGADVLAISRSKLKESWLMAPARGWTFSSMSQ